MFRPLLSSRAMLRFSMICSLAIVAMERIASAADAERPPNIVFILADDMDGSAAYRP